MAGLLSQLSVSRYFESIPGIEVTSPVLKVHSVLHTFAIVNSFDVAYICLQLDTRTMRISELVILNFLTDKPIKITWEIHCLSANVFL